MSTLSFIAAMMLAIYFSIIAACPLFESKTRSFFWILSLSWFVLIELVSIYSTVVGWWLS